MADASMNRSTRTPSSASSMRTRRTEENEARKSGFMNFETTRHYRLVSSINRLETSLLPTRKTVAVETVKSELKVIKELTWNSSEFYLPAAVPIVRVGIIGDQDSDREKLVRTFLGPGEVKLYPDVGARTKYMMRIDNQDHLVLFREEVVGPMEDFILWVDVLLIVANSEETTRAAEDYMLVFERFRNIEEVFVLKASLQSAPGQCMAFHTRMTRLVRGSDHHIVDVNSSRSVHNLFKYACEEYVRLKSERSRPVAGPFCTPRTPVTPLNRRTPNQSARETRSVARTRAQNNPFTPKDQLQKDRKAGPSSSLDSEHNDCASSNRERRVRFGLVTEKVVGEETAAGSSATVKSTMNPSNGRETRPCRSVRTESIAATTPANDRKILKPHSGTRKGSELSVPYFRMGVKRKYPVAEVPTEGIYEKPTPPESSKKPSKDNGLNVTINID